MSLHLPKRGIPLALRFYSMPPTRPVSVGRRLFGLVAVSAVTTLLLLGVALVASSELKEHARYRHRYVFAPLSAIGAVLDDAAQLRVAVATEGDGGQSERLLSALGRFLARYRAEWQLAGSSSDDAIRQLDTLRRAHELGLVELERQAVEELDVAVQRVVDQRRAGASPVELRESISSVRLALYKLLDINIQFDSIAQRSAEQLITKTAWLMGTVGLFGLGASILFGLRVRAAIAPRIARLVSSVQKFKEGGPNDFTQESGNDDITILNNALYIGFAAIEARDRERERFLSVAAHELKTPVSNIQAFAHAALDYPSGSSLRDHALEVIAKQTHRISRLVEDLFLVAEAKSRELPFAPAPIKLAELTENVAGEVESLASGRHFALELAQAVPLLADPSLLTHALWTLLTYAIDRAPAETRVRVRVSCVSGRARVAVSGFGPMLSPTEIEEVFAPLTTLRYESVGTIPRQALGLYLCREIARVHGGSVHAENADGAPVLTLELPA